MSLVFTSLFVQTTTACNAACNFCPHPFTYGNRGDHKKGVMQNRVWQRIVDDLAANEYAGGIDLYLQCEPFLDPHLVERLADLRARVPKGFIVLSTNAASLPPRLEEGLVAHPPHRLHIDVISADPEQYRALTGLNLEVTINNARRLIEIGRERFEVEINCPVLPSIDASRLQALFSGQKVNIDFWANSRGGLVAGTSARDRGSRFKIVSNKVCKLPEGSLNVLFDGSILICCNDWAQLSRPYLPRIGDASLSEIAQSAVVRRVASEFSHGNYRRFPMCTVCADEMGYTIDRETKAYLPHAAAQMSAVRARLSGQPPPRFEGLWTEEPRHDPHPSEESSAREFGLLERAGDWVRRLPLGARVEETIRTRLVPGLHRWGRLLAGRT